MPTMLQRGAIRAALDRSLDDPRVVVIGEDIGIYGGAFQVSAGLQKKHPTQIIQTPISESGICGLSIGMALAGFKPILEVMFMDFSTQIIDQLLNQAVKFNGMYNGQLSVPLLIRTPAGGYRGYGPTHSQSLENLFASIHDLKIVYPYSGQDYYSILLYLIQNLNSPVLFIENKTLYLKKSDVDTSLVFSPEAKVIKSGGKTLVISYGHAIDIVIEAMNKLQEEWSIIDLVSLKPIIGMDTILEQVAKHERVILVSESPSYASVLEHLVYKIQKKMHGRLKTPIEIVSSNDSFIPARTDKEKEVLLSSDDIVMTVRGY